MSVVHHVNQHACPEGGGLNERFGLRGLNLIHLARLRAPIAPAFMVESSSLGRQPPVDRYALRDAMVEIETASECSFNDAEKPLLLKVLISPSILVRSVDSIHAIGLHEGVLTGFARQCGEAFAYQEYQLLIRNFAMRFLEIPQRHFEALDAAHTGLSAAERCRLYAESVDFPQDGYQQLEVAIRGLCRAYYDDPMNEGIEAGLVVQKMAYGNSGNASCSGDFYTRDPVRGQSGLNGCFVPNSFAMPAEADPEKREAIASLPLLHLEALKKVAEDLEACFLDIRHVRFVVEQDRLWLLAQDPARQRSTQAELKMLLDLYQRRVLSSEALTRRILPAQLLDLLLPVVDPRSVENLKEIRGGIAGSPGAATGKAVFSTRTLLEHHHRALLAGYKENLILLMPHTEAEDVEAIELGVGVIASEGDYASHAPVVARSLRKPCLLYASIRFHDTHVEIDGHRVNEFDELTLSVSSHGEDNAIWLGAAELRYPDTAENGVERFMQGVDSLELPLRILGQIETPGDIKKALRLGAGGIGMFPCDQLLSLPEIQLRFQEVLLVHDAAKRDVLRRELETLLEAQFRRVFEEAEGKSIWIQLLRGPLSHFMPHRQSEIEAVQQHFQKHHPEISVERLEQQMQQFRALNPILGLCGCRIAVSYPYIYELFTTAILRAAYALHSEQQQAPHFSLVVPTVMTDAEMRFVRYGRRIEGKAIRGIQGVERDLLRTWGLERLPFTYPIGVRIETPAAMLGAGHIAKQSDFLCIDTDMLTQTTNGLSFDDLSSFLPAYSEFDILKEDPFDIISAPVKNLIDIAKNFGRMTRPDIEIGLLGRHLGNAENVTYAIDEGLDFVCCDVYRIPVAKLAAARRLASEG